LDEVPGIGEAKKVRLLSRFKSIYGIAKASREEIAAVAAVNLATAAEVLKVAANAATEK
jgi:excinuclease UvrABC nuclease subunit